MVGALALAVTACGRGGQSETTAVAAGAASPTTPQSATTAPIAGCETFQEQFGPGFCKAYRQTANSTPREIQAGDIAAVDLTKKPIAVP